MATYQVSLSLLLETLEDHPADSEIKQAVRDALSESELWQVLTVDVLNSSAKD